ncbi:hypothetical protein [Rhizobium esperanzae]|uniref:Uncharacterized protein n=1 Tax=Rhizobium esperanzae TaxID=1967781 RepID=A0A7W6R2D1_9HYPH|nr:hypothetical protein [Rhizobium esperanzae]MBB4235561.1 hypothetical protein [Rhizobium esperanzae]
MATALMSSQVAARTGNFAARAGVDYEQFNEVLLVETESADAGSRSGQICRLDN